MLKNIFLDLRNAPPPVQRLAAVLFLVGIHSLMLGLFIFFCTDRFYQIFFHTTAVNFFYVRQSGLFLVCLALFYLMPLINLKKYHHFVWIVILNKLMAVLFLAIHASITLSPMMIFMAAVVDGGIAFLLLFFYHNASDMLPA